MYGRSPFTGSRFIRYWEVREERRHCRRDSRASAAYALLQHSPVGKRDGIAVEIDRAVVFKACYGAVSSQIPCTAAFDGDDGVVFDCGAALRIVDNVDGACEAAAVFERHAQRGNS